MIPTEPIGSIPRPTELIAIEYDAAIEDTERRSAAGIEAYSRDLARIRARVAGTAIAAKILGTP